MSVNERLAELCEQVAADPAQIGVLSHGEQIAVAVVFNRIDWLKAAGVNSLSAAHDRLGPTWTAACREVRRQRESDT